MRLLMLVMSVVWLGGCASQATLTPRGAATQQPHADEMLVVTVHNPIAPGRASVGSTLRGYALSGGYTVSAAARQSMASLAKDYALELVDSWPITALGVHCAVFTWREAVTRSEMLGRLAADRRVESVQPLHLFSSASRARGGAAPSDPHRGMQHGADLLQLEAAQRFSRGAGVRIAVIDTQVDALHPDLAGRVTRQHDLVGDGRMVGEHHGTAVSGVMAAVGGNGEGILGIAPEAQLIALRACWEQEARGSVCNSFTLARALSVALDEQVDIVNLSLAGPQDPLLSRLAQQLVQDGVFLVGAESEVYPLGFPGGLAGVAVARVAEVDAARATGSIPAPGQRILTTLPDGRYAFEDGSSLSAAHVSGVAALALSARPSLSPSELREALSAAAGPRVLRSGSAETWVTSLSACSVLINLNIAPAGCESPVLASGQP